MDAVTTAPRPPTAPDQPAPPAPEADALEPLTRTGPTRVSDARGRELVLLGGCDYLCLSQHPAVVGAAREALARFGLSAGASRTTTGNHPAHDALEHALGEFLHVDATLLVPDGYVANIAACQAARLLGIARARIHPNAHPSLRDAVLAAGLAMDPWPHSTLSPDDRPRSAEPSVWLSDGVFTGDGSVALVREILARMGPDDLLILDDCHGFAVLGEGGRGTCAHPGVRDERVVITTTLAKGLGAAGGAVCGTARVVNAARRSSAFVCTTPIAPALAAASSAALAVLRAEPQRPARACANGQLLRAAVRAAGIAVPDSPAPIVTFALRDELAMRALQTRLREAGFLAPLIRYPGGPAPCYFRLIAMSEHERGELDRVRALLSPIPT